VVLVVAVSLSTAVWSEHSLHRLDVLSEYPERPAPGRGTTWLLVGSDSRADLTEDQRADLTTGGDLGDGRTDTILMVHVPEIGSSTPTTMVSIPRDSYVPIPGYGRDKINTAFAVGGPSLLAQTVEQATGLRLDHYAEVGFGGFAALVDALGGVEMCTAEPIDDPLAGLALPAGCHDLDGTTALGFVRTRATPRADLDRMVNQRSFMSAVLGRVTSPTVWANPWRWYSVPRAATAAVEVGRGEHVWDIARLGWALSSNVTTLTVPIGEFASNDSGDVVVWDHDSARELFAALADDRPVPQAALDSQP
jgi:LCP family protein required for cell wall assembly